jgi:hypothetical protein
VIAASTAWLVAGALTALAGKRARRWVLAAFLLLAAVSSVLAVHMAPDGRNFSTQIATVTSLLLAGMAIVCVIVGERVERGAVVTFAFAIGLCGVSVSASNQLGAAETLFAAALVVGVRWMACAPGRQTVSGVRSIGIGAALLLGITPLLPVNQTALGPWPALVVGLIVGGVVLLLGMFPSGEWSVSLVRHATGLDIAGWIFVLVPATFLFLQRCMLALPTEVATTTKHLLLGVAVAGVIWSGAHSLGSTGSRRYMRLLNTDICLGVAALMAGSWGAVVGLQLLFGAHLLAFAFLCKGGTPSRGWWLVVGSLPPAPGFWARLALAFSCASNGPFTLTVALGALVLSALICGFELARKPEDIEATPRTGVRRLAPVFSTVCGAAALFLALDPAQALRSAFGG